MTPREAVMLCRYVKACCPQQQIDEYTPDAWHDLLGDLRLDDCRAAVAAVAARQPFVAPAEIKAEVKRIRADRLEGFIYVPTPGADYLTDLRTQIAAVADGRREPAPALPAGPDRSAERDALLAELFPKPPASGKPTTPQAAETPEETRERLLSEAYAYLITIDDAARTKALEAARAQLGDGAPRAELVMLAAQITDAKPLPARPDKATADLMAEQGCPNGCPLGTHVKPCHFAEAS